jgi:uncharacterized membrane protein
MRSKFAIKGHPIHPILVTLPIGLFIWAFVADMVYLGTDKDRLWYDTSYYAGLAAIVAALIAALPGLGDLLTVAIKTKAAPLAILHMLTTVTVVALFAVAAVIQMDDAALSGSNLTIVIALHGVGVALLGLAGFVGGELMVRHHVGIIPHDDQYEEVEQLRHTGWDTLASRQESYHSLSSRGQPRSR